MPARGRTILFLFRTKRETRFSRNFGRFLFLGLFFIFASPVFAASAKDVVITEIMYNPSGSQGNDSYNEWIEIYNLEGHTINLEDWTLCDQKLLAGYVNYPDESGYKESELELKGNSYGVITDGRSGTEVYANFSVDNDALALHVDAASICGGLSNEEDIVILKDNSTLIDSVSYTSSWGGNGNGSSLERVSFEGESNNQDNWQDGPFGGTPGKINQLLTPSPSPNPSSSPSPLLPPSPSSAPAPSPTSSPTPSSSPTSSPKPIKVTGATLLGKILGEGESSPAGFFPWEATEEAGSQEATGSTKIDFLPKLFLGLGFIFLVSAGGWLCYTRLRVKIPIKK